MADERVDKAKGVIESFSKDLKALSTPDSHREFILKYFSSPDAKENMLNIVGLGELGDRDLVKWEAFQRLFKHVAYREFSKKTSGFADEQIKLGFML